MGEEISKFNIVVLTMQHIIVDDKFQGCQNHILHGHNFYQPELNWHSEFITPILLLQYHNSISTSGSANSKTAA
jgi:hypothetical protein